MVRVVHVGAGVCHCELIRVCLSGFDGRLRDEGYAILIVGDFEAVKVNRRRFRQLVLENDAHAVALTDADLGTGYHAVVRPAGHELSGLGLPLHDLRGQLVDPHAADDG